jgi:hypothetical protein
MTDAAKRVQMLIEFAEQSEPISGTISHSGREPQPFTGWLELLGALGAVQELGRASLDELRGGHGSVA